MSSCSSPCGTNVSLSFLQAEMLNDPEFAKNVKGLEGMLRVRERLGESSRVCVPARNSALHSGRRDAGSVAPGVTRVGVEGGFCPPLRVQFAGCGVRDFSDGGVGAFSLHSSASTGCRGCAPCPAENTLQFQGTAFDDDTITPSSNAGCRGYAPCAAENTREFKGTDCDDDSSRLRPRQVRMENLDCLR